MKNECGVRGKRMIACRGRGKKQGSRHEGVWSWQNSIPILEGARGILEGSRGLCVFVCLAGNPHEGQYAMTAGADIRGRGLGTGLNQDMKYRIISKCKTRTSLKTSSSVGPHRWLACSRKRTALCLSLFLVREA